MARRFEIGEEVMAKTDSYSSWKLMTVRGFGFKKQQSYSYRAASYSDGTPEKHSHVFVSEAEKPNWSRACYVCEGLGHLDQEDENGLPQKLCDRCNGTGKLTEKPYVHQDWVINRKTHILSMEDYEIQIAEPARARKLREEEGARALAQRKANHLNKIAEIVLAGGDNMMHDLAGYVYRWGSARHSDPRNYRGYTVQGEIYRAAQEFLDLERTAKEWKEKATV